MSSKHRERDNRFQGQSQGSGCGIRTGPLMGRKNANVYPHALGKEGNNTGMAHGEKISNNFKDIDANQVATDAGRDDRGDAIDIRKIDICSLLK